MGENPTSTGRIFSHERVADGYSRSRPFLHPQVFARVRPMLPCGLRLGRGLDVGCGTGLSSLAMLDLVPEVVGVDASVEMLRRATRQPRISYVASSAEALPFARGCFDLIVACGSIDWVDRERFLPAARELLSQGGWLVSLDFGDLGRSEQVPGLEQWYKETFLRLCPRPDSPDPMISDEEAARHGFSNPAEGRFEVTCPFGSRRYAEFLLTESSVIAAVEYGNRRAGDILQWLAAELAPLFGDEVRELEFGGYVQVLRRN